MEAKVLCMTAIGVIKLKCGQLDIVKVNLLWDTHVLKNLNGEILEGPSNCEIIRFLNYKYTVYMRTCIVYLTQSM